MDAPAGLLRKADEAMYLVKNSTRNNIALAGQGLLGDRIIDFWNHGEFLRGGLRARVGNAALSCVLLLHAALA